MGQAKSKGMYQKKQTKRADLAVVSDGKPRLLLEAKAMYCSDMYAGNAKTKFPSRVYRDVEKLHSFRPDYDVERAVIILLTRIGQCSEGKIGGVMKYQDRLKKSNKSLEEIKPYVEDNFNIRPIHCFGSIGAGQAFGVDVTVHYWLFGPLSAGE